MLSTLLRPALKAWRDRVDASSRTVDKTRAALQHRWIA